MKLVILAGGLGTRLAEETTVKPKPMVEIGGRPILWHIMKTYAYHGINEFVICCGYKGYLIKEYFANYFLHMSDVTFDLSKNQMEVHQKNVEPWKVTLVDTGEQTMTGGRLLRVKDYLNDGTFCLTYGDGVGDVDIAGSIEQHKQMGKKATVTAVRPPARFGALEIKDNVIESFQEKPTDEQAYINGGFFVLEPEVFDYLEGDPSVFERDVLPNLAREKQLASFVHKGFWQPMDTLRDKNQLNALWDAGEAPWKIWKS